MKTKLVLLAFLVLALILLPGCALPGDPFGNYPSPTPTSISGDRPFFTTEDERVRYILADLQLGNIPLANGTENPPSFQTAYSLWNQGVRVVNIEQFILDPSPITFSLENSDTILIGAVLYRSTNEIINPGDVILTTDVPVVTQTPIPIEDTPIPVPTPIPQNLCDIPYWPIREGAYWIYDEYDFISHYQVKMTVHGIVSIGSETSFTVTFEYMGGNGGTHDAHYTCTRDGIFDEQGHYMLPFTQAFQDGATYQANGHAVKSRLEQINVPKGTFNVVDLCWQESNYVWCYDFSTGVGPVRLGNPFEEYTLVDYYIPPVTSMTENPSTPGSSTETTISGMIGYPSEGWCPEMNLYARNAADNSQYSIHWNTGECTFSVTVPAPGQYILFAWPVGKFSNLGFMYSEDCVNPKPLSVNRGEPLTNIWLTFCPGTAPTPADVNSLAGLSGKIIYLTEANNVSEVFIMNADGSNLTNITPAGVGQNIYDPALSPDHSKVAFIGGEMDEIYIMDADGTYPIQLTHHASYAGCWALAWSPDGDRIAFDCVSDENGYHQIYSMRPDGSGITNLTNTSGSNSFKPSWSPDGRKIVFQSDRSGNSFDCGGICQAVDDIFVMSSDGSNTVRLTTSRFFHSDPAWSPDGSKIVYHSEDMQGDWFTIMNADGSNAIDLKCDDGFICGYPAWSPDSQKIIFNRYEFVNESGAWVSKNYKIFIMNIDGSNRTFITDGIHPLWVP